jgi:hypothetical protein
MVRQILWYLLWGTAIIKHIMAQTGEACYSRATQENTVNSGEFVNNFFLLSILRHLVMQHLKLLLK